MFVSVSQFLFRTETAHKFQHQRPRHLCIFLHLPLKELSCWLTVLLLQCIGINDPIIYAAAILRVTSHSTYPVVVEHRMPRNNRVQDLTLMVWHQCGLIML